MKILFVTDCYPSEDAPQKCIFIEQQAKALMDLGYQVDVLIPTHVANPRRGSVCHTHHGVSIISLEYALSAISRFFYQRIRSFEEDLEQVVVHNGYDVVSIHIAPDSIKSMVLRVCNANHIKTVLHYHGLNVAGDYDPVHPLYDRYLVSKRKRLLKKADAVVGVSHRVCRAVHGIMPNIKTYPVYNGVDCSFFTPLSDKQLKNNSIISCVANLIAIKGHWYLIKAFHTLCEKHVDKNLILNIVGTGAEYDDLTNLVEALGLESQVVFHGALPYESVAEILQGSDIFAMPSYFEALGCVYLEAMACKVPVIGCWGQGIEDVITDGVTGMLAKPRDVHSLVDKLSMLVENESFRHSMGEAGYKLVRDKFTWHDSAVHLQNVYDEILHSNI